MADAGAPEKTHQADVNDGEGEGSRAGGRGFQEEEPQEQGPQAGNTGLIRDRKMTRA